MINRVIHILSNRSGPFDLFDLPRNEAFVPRRLSSAQTLIRKLLYLDKGDYYINALLAALQAYPDIANFIQDNVQSFDLTTRRPDPVHIEGGAFLVDKNLQGRWLDNDHKLPLNLTYTITFVSESLVTIRSEDRGEQVTVGATTIGTDPEKTLRVDWPSSVPFSGPIKLSQTWTTGSRLLIHVQPRNFPYDAYVARVKGNPYVNQQLHRLLLQEEFFSAEDAVERAAILALCLVTDDVEPISIQLADEILAAENGVPCGFRVDSTLVTVDSMTITADHFNCSDEPHIPSLRWDSTVHTCDETDITCDLV